MKKIFLLLVTVIMLIGCKQISSEEIVDKLDKSGKLDLDFSKKGYILDKTAQELYFKGPAMLGRIVNAKREMNISSQDKFFVLTFDEPISVEHAKYLFERLNVYSANADELIAFFKQNRTKIPLSSKVIALSNELMRVPSGNFYNWSGGYLFLTKNLEGYNCELFDIEMTSDSGDLREKYDTIIGEHFSFLVKLK